MTEIIPLIALGVGVFGGFIGGWCACQMKHETQRRQAKAWEEHCDAIWTQYDRGDRLGAQVKHMDTKATSRTSTPTRLKTESQGWHPEALETTRQL